MFFYEFVARVFVAPPMVNLKKRFQKSSSLYSSIVKKCTLQCLMFEHTRKGKTVRARAHIQDGDQCTLQCSMFEHTKRKNLVRAHIQDGDDQALPIISAAFSATIMIPAIGFELGTMGKMDASATRIFGIPCTRSSASTTAVGSVLGPILHVPD